MPDMTIELPVSNPVHWLVHSILHQRERVIAAHAGSAQDLAMQIHPGDILLLKEHIDSGPLKVQDAEDGSPPVFLDIRMFPNPMLRLPIVGVSYYVPSAHSRLTDDRGRPLEDPSPKSEPSED